MENTALFIVISPVAGLLLGGLVMLALRGLLRNSEVARTEKRFRALQLVSSAAVSIAHGGNDAPKTMGVVAALLVSSGHLTAGSGGKLPIPDWVAIGCYIAIAIGTLSGGWRIVRTMGSSITRLRPVSGFAAETSAAGAIIGSTLIGAPVSTTHTVAGAITGVGTTNRGASVNWKVFGKLVIAWVVTMPIAAAIAATAWEPTTRPAPIVAGVVMTAIVLALVILLAIALRHAPTASDTKADDQLDAEREYPLRAGGGSLGHARQADPVTPGAHPAGGSRRRCDEGLRAAVVRRQGGSRGERGRRRPVQRYTSSGWVTLRTVRSDDLGHVDTTLRIPFRTAVRLVVDDVDRDSGAFGAVTATRVL